MRGSILEDAPASPSSLRPAVPKAFDAIVRKAIEEDPAERYQSVGDLAVDLLRAKAPHAKGWLVPGRLALTPPATTFPLAPRAGYSPLGLP